MRIFRGEDMNEKIRIHIEKYPAEVVKMFKILRELIYDSADVFISEKLWAGLPSYYADEAFIRLIPFNDHINIEATAVIIYREELADYKITLKGMLQIYVEQNLPTEILKQIFFKTLCG